MGKIEIQLSNIVKASEIYHRYSDLRKRANDGPFFIVTGNKIEQVLMSVDEYERICQRNGY